MVFTKTGRSMKGTIIVIGWIIRHQKPYPVTLNLTIHSNSATLLDLRVSRVKGGFWSGMRSRDGAGTNRRNPGTILSHTGTHLSEIYTIFLTTASPELRSSAECATRD